MDMDVEVRRLRMQGRDPQEIANRCGLDVLDVEERLAEAWRGPEYAGPSDPNELTIKLIASAIRQHWSPEEEARRRGGNCNWTPPDAQESLFGKPGGNLRYRSR